MAIGRIFKDTTADNMEFFKKAIWLNGPYTFYSNFRSFADYLEKANNTDLEKGILFLKDIYTYEVKWEGYPLEDYPIMLP